MKQEEKQIAILPQKCEHTPVAMVGYAFMIVGTIIMALFIIPMFWCIPMTVSVKRRIVNKRHIGAGFKVCTLLFVSVIAAILLFCDNESPKESK